MSDHIQLAIDTLKRATAELEKLTESALLAREALKHDKDLIRNLECLRDEQATESLESPLIPDQMPMQQHLRLRRHLKKCLKGR
jgi:hypothetical protein